ncbi:hypothetical protein GCM10010182_82040 [Actinomadura cremea]|nr:hypothetical protein GCM10010182_82040 [Actinomadura cremea]
MPGAVAAPDDPLLARVAGMPADQTEQLLDHLTVQWHVLVRADNLLGPRHAIDGVTAQLRILRAMLTSARPPARGDALRLAARYAESAAWLHEDAGEMRLSRRWTGQAMEWALEAGDRTMIAWTLFRRSQQAQHDGNGGEVIGLAAAARREQGEQPGPMMAALLQQQAQGLALDRDERACHTMLDHAYEHAAEGDSGDASAGHGAFCTPAYLDIQRGRCWLTLGRPGRAADAFQTAVGGLAPAYQRDQGVAYAGLSAAPWDRGHLGRGRRGLAGLPARARGPGPDRFQLVISDAHRGLVEAIGSTLPGASWQRCRTHYLRNLLTRVPKGAQPWVATLVRTIFDQPAAEEVHAQHARVVDSLAAEHPDAAEHLDQAAPDLLAFTGFPRQIWRQIWSNCEDFRVLSGRGPARGLTGRAAFGMICRSLLRAVLAAVGPADVSR